MTSFELVMAVRNGGCWDWKQVGSVYADFGNFFYGEVTAAKGWPRVVAKAGAGLAQIVAGTSVRYRDFTLWTSSSYGDDTGDQSWIDAGADAWGRSLKSSSSDELPSWGHLLEKNISREGWWRDPPEPPPRPEPSQDARPENPILQ